MRLLSVVILALFAVTECRAKLIDHVSEVPQCGLQCLLKLIPESVCQVVTNDSCICTNEVLFNNIETCVSASCDGIDSLAVLRAKAAGCGDPVRSRKPELWALLGIEAFALFCCGLRLWSRWKMNIWWMDDYIMVLVVAIFIPFTFISVYDRLMAFGVDVWTVPPELLTEALKMFYVDEALYLVIITVTKVMVLAFYYRIFPPRRFRMCCIGVMIFVVASGFSCLMAQLLQCLPIRYNWDGWRKDEPFDGVKCVDINALITSCACLVIFQDIVILVLPVPLTLQLKASWRKRAGIILMFSLGVFITMTSCLRLQYILRFKTSTNPTWDNTDALIWTTLEVNVAVIVGCLPAIRGYLGIVLPKAFGTTQESKGSKPSAPRLYGSSVSKPAFRSHAKKISHHLDLDDTAISLSEMTPTKAQRDSDSESQIAFAPSREEDPKV